MAAKGDKSICASVATWDFLQAVLHHPRVKKIEMPEAFSIGGFSQGDRIVIKVETWDADCQKVALKIEKGA